jgi:hypothetical protein
MYPLYYRTSHCTTFSPTLNELNAVSLITNTCEDVVIFHNVILHIITDPHRFIVVYVLTKN